MRFRILFLLFLLVELASLAAYFYPTLNIVGFFVIVGAALVLSLRRLEYGLYFVLVDLVLGGKSGALFSLEYGGFFLSLRMALFIVVMGVWVGEVVSTRLHNAPQPPLNLRGGVLWWWGVLGLAVVWGMVVGLARGNDFGNLFLDANGYFYGVLILPFWWVSRWEPNYESTRILRIRNIRTHSPFGSLSTVFLTATTLLALKTLFAVYWFTHAGNNFIAANLVPFYGWVRDSGVGEITWLEGNFARVFFQSHVFNIAAFFVLLAGLITPSTSPYLRRPARSESDRSVGLKGRKLLIWALLALNASVIIVSLSRSFWVGVVVGVVLLLIGPIGPIGPIRRIGRIGKTAIGSGVFAVLLILVVARFPLPRPSPIDLGAAAQSRLAFEPAAASRWNLLPVLWRAVREHPILGSGFGRTVTYISNDPRVREQSPTGEYTTYAFEWGWLDFWLKLGLIGLIGPIGLIIALARTSYRKAMLAGLPSTELALVLGLASIHVFTPYLNHPLGIGMLALLTILTIHDKVGERGFETSSRVLTQRA